MKTVLVTRIACASICALIAGCGPLPSKDLSKPVACQNMLYADMASLAYHLKASQDTYVPPTPSEWRRIDLKGTPIDPNHVMPVSRHWLTGLAYDIWQSSTDTNTYVFAYRGSNALNDWIFGILMAPISPPYRQARNEYREFRARVGECADVTAIGHSLGGGIALSLSLREEIPAVVFNTSPRINDGLGTVPNEKKRLLIFQKGEVVQKARFFWRYKLSKVIPEENRYEADLDDGATHRHDILAKELRHNAKACGEPVFADVSPHTMIR